jgi:hypothetical protein
MRACSHLPIFEVDAWSRVRISNHPMSLVHPDLFAVPDASWPEPDYLKSARSIASAMA